MSCDAKDCSEMQDGPNNSRASQTKNYFTHAESFHKKRIRSLNAGPSRRVFDMPGLGLIKSYLLNSHDCFVKQKYEKDSEKFCKLAGLLGFYI